jgi:EAL domain-containing protein (putative c-di-GMP-specific phosphodiesterase class I)
MRPHFQPIVELTTGHSIGREALMRGKLGTVELRGAELLAAAEAHDALFSFDYRARTAALEVGLPLMPEGEVLFVNLDPRASLDVDSSLRTTWPVVGRLGADPSRICLEIVKPERCPDRELLQEMVAAHRKRGALVGLDDLSGGPDSLACLELLRPDVAKIDTALTAGIQHSSARRALVQALVDCAHELGAKVVAEGVERVDEFRAMAELGVDLRAERDHAPERPALDLELLVDAVVGRALLGLPVAREHELASAHLELDGVRVDPGEIGAHDRARRVARVVDVDGGREAAAAARREPTVEHVAEQLVHLAPHPLEVREEVPLRSHRGLMLTNTRGRSPTASYRPARVRRRHPGRCEVAPGIHPREPEAPWPTSRTS